MAWRPQADDAISHELADGDCVASRTMIVPVVIAGLDPAIHGSLKKVRGRQILTVRKITDRYYSLRPQ
jgi:hypothetical protein